MQEYEYWYVTKFNLPDAMAGKHIHLHFAGMDYSCDVWLNGHYLGGHEGMFSSFAFDVTQLVRFDQWFEGSNILMLKLDPPPRNCRASDNKQIMEAVGEAVKEETNTPYGLAFPMSGPYGKKLGFKPKESAHANEHYYGAGTVFMEEYYPQLDFCIIPELTAASAPAIDSLEFIPADELWPMGVSWGYHGADIDILRFLNF